MDGDGDNRSHVLACIDRSNLVLWDIDRVAWHCIGRGGRLGSGGYLISESIPWKGKRGVMGSDLYVYVLYHIEISPGMDVSKFLTLRVGCRK